MRKRIDLNGGWLFSFEGGEKTTVSLPHTWNSEDGQDGGADYKRGVGVYEKTLARTDLPTADKYYIEFDGANSITTLYVNGEQVGTHEGGYSRFRFDITKYTDSPEIQIRAEVDNSPEKNVYPEVADFTFWGGIYRPVSIIATGLAHFALDYYGSDGIAVTPRVDGDTAEISIRVYLTGEGVNHTLKYAILDREGRAVAETVTKNQNTTLTLKNPNLWRGKTDPYLYTARVSLLDGGQTVDEVECEFGCRSFSVDADRGFILNGKEYSLRGVSRHQDRKNRGNALLPRHHEEDISHILDVGANTVRLAHYQQSDYFYTLCDRAGLVVWAEIPYISQHNPDAEENTLSQMRELIIQNYNHPSIVFWGLSNEITMRGSSRQIYENHEKLQELARSLDPTRLTAIACVSTCDPSDPYLTIPDVVAYNHYFGWYGGEVEMNGKWFDTFHAEHPDIPIGISEYGCEGLDFHSVAPTQGDYTEEYQAYYHEELIKQIISRPYLFATYVWNMFDFGADARCEGGEPGQNHKGLMTYDRKYKKDAYFAYRAHWSSDPFVHIGGKRYADRAEKLTRVTVYSNLPVVELFVNGRSLGKKRSPDRFFKYEVPLERGENKITAIAGRCRDEATLIRTEKPNGKYVLRESLGALNWFDIKEREGYLSIKDKISVIQSTSEGASLLRELFDYIGRAAKSASEGKAEGFELSADMMKMMESFTLMRMLGMLGMMGVTLSKEELLSINDRLYEIKKNDIHVTKSTK